MRVRTLTCPNRRKWWRCNPHPGRQGPLPPPPTDKPMPDRRKPLVFLVGAGPGHPGLLTLRAVECLAQADLVVYDRLVPPRLLDHAPADAERLCVADLPGGHAERYPHVQNVLIEAARAGKRVVRLKGGDPF